MHWKTPMQTAELRQQALRLKGIPMWSKGPTIRSELLCLRSYETQFSLRCRIQFESCGDWKILSGDLDHEDFARNCFGMTFGMFFRTCLGNSAAMAFGMFECLQNLFWAMMWPSMSQFAFEDTFLRLRME